MLKNRPIQMRFVKTAEGGDLAEVADMPKFDLPSKETVKEVSAEVTKNSAIAVIAVIAAAAAARTISEIVIHHATK